VLSDDVRLLTHPFRVYRELGAADDPAPLRAAVTKAGLLLLVVGAFVSLTSAGRLVAFHVASAFVFYLFAPVVQAASIALATRAVAPAASVPRALSLYFSGFLPWKLLLLFVAIVPLVAPDAYEGFIWILRTGILPGSMLVTIGYSVALTYAGFRAGLELSRPRALAATAIHYVVFVGLIVGWYVVTNQLPPQFPGIP
jgi:hypothetical protein